MADTVRIGWGDQPWPVVVDVGDEVLDQTSFASTHQADLPHRDVLSGGWHTELVTAVRRTCLVAHDDAVVYRQKILEREVLERKRPQLRESLLNASLPRNDSIGSIPELKTTSLSTSSSKTPCRH